MKKKGRKLEPDNGKSRGETSSQGADKAVAEERDLDFYLKTIEDLRRERDNYYELLLRKQAEFENFRKRTAKEREEVVLNTEARVLRELLPVVDACEKALETLPEKAEDPALEAYREGFQLLLQQLQSFLAKHGVNPVEGVGAQFDPNLHEAVVREVTAEHEEGKILDEYRRGYQIRDRLLRPSQVKVAVSPQMEESDSSRS